MVEPLKKDDITNTFEIWKDLQKQWKEHCGIGDTKYYIEVSRIKEIVKDIIAFSVTTNSRVELQCKIINRFGVLFDNNLKDVPEANDQTSIDDSGVVGKTGKPPQSPKTRDHILVDKDKPPQIISHLAVLKPVGVSSLCQNCGHKKEQHLDNWCGQCYDEEVVSSCSGFVEKTK